MKKVHNDEFGETIFLEKPIVFQNQSKDTWPIKPKSNPITLLFLFSATLFFWHKKPKSSFENITYHPLTQAPDSFD